MLFMRQVSGTLFPNAVGSEAARKGATLDHTLATYIGDGPADSSVLQIFRRVVQALSAIHAAGASHLPLSAGTIRLSDSGQPELVSSNRPRKSTDTVAFGSAKYSAPEAFGGTTGSSSCELVDCYVLAFIFYEILIGKQLFFAQFSQVQSGSPALWLKWHADLTAKPRPLAELRPDLGQFAHIIDEMMEKDPAKRLGSFSEVLTAFSNFEVRTVCNTDPLGLRPAAPNALTRAVQTGKKLVFRAGKYANQFATFRKPPIVFVGLSVLVLAALGALIFFLHRAAALRHTQLPIAAARRSSARPSTEAAIKSVPLSAPAPNQAAANQSHVPAESETQLQIESHLRSRTLLLPDDLLVPIEIRANVNDATIVINGQKLKRKLNQAAGLLRLRAGEYRIKLIHAGYHDSAEQRLLISGNEQRRQLQFRLLPAVEPSTSAVASLPPPDLSTVGASNVIGGQVLMPLAKITFHVFPQGAQIICRRKDDPRSQGCGNNQSCLLPAGAYEITAIASGFKPLVSQIAIGAGEDNSYEWKLEAISSALNPADVFEDGQNWTVEANGWWSHKQSGYSFLRAGRGTFVFDILQSAGLFTTKKVSLVINYRSEGDRVLYTIDEHRLHRSERSPGFQTDYSVAHDIPAGPIYRLTVELLGDRVIIRNAAGRTLDDLALVNPAGGKAGFSGKVKLKVIATGYPQYAKDSGH